MGERIFTVIKSEESPTGKVTTVLQADRTEEWAEAILFWNYGDDSSIARDKIGQEYKVSWEKIED